MTDRAVRAMKRMSLAKASIVVFVAVALLTTAFMVKMSQGEALPSSSTDSAVVPHYAGPWPNWVLSPTTQPDAVVAITSATGTGAAATASVDQNGVVTGITVTNPGSGYVSANVAITGTGVNAAATAVITASGVVTGVTVNAGGSGYKALSVALSGGGATTSATATAYGGVDVITVTNSGFGYHFPTVDFDMPDDPNGTQAVGAAIMDADGAITGIDVTTAGSGYITAPSVVIRDGTVADPIRDNPGLGASATATLRVVSVALDTFGAGYTSAPTVTFTDTVGNGSGASATAAVDSGGVTAINVTTPGSGYLTGGGIKKFQDALPGLCNPAVAGSCPSYLTSPGAKYIPLGVPEVKPYTDPKGRRINADEYEIALVQYRTNFNSDLPDTLARGYVQLETPANAAISQHYPLTNANIDPNVAPTPALINGVQAYGVTPPQWLGPTISATKNKPVRIVFRNLLPTGAAGDLFLPTDSTIMGSGMGPSMAAPAPVDNNSVMDGVRNPVCSEYPKPNECFKDNRATLHLHGGTSPWISDGTPHQWITPANQTTPWPQGVSVQNVPDMPGYNSPTDGAQTFFYTNQQSARLMFYHDHAWGITRLNVYAGEAAGYLIGDETEQKLVDNGIIPGAADTIPLVVQDRTFVPQKSKMYDVDINGLQPGDVGFDPTQIETYGQDPTWNAARWGGYGSFWYHHVYMPAQNPSDPSGMSAYGRWMYGPWFWPPAAATTFGPIPNPYYDPACDLNDPATWTYQVDPFCEPLQIPGTPNISAGMEQFNDTPIVNGVAYPTVTLEPKTYRLRVLNAANDRFLNFQWYVADPTTASTGLNKAGQVIGGTEVALNPAELLAAQTDPVVFPTPALGSTGPDWIHIGSEGGFLPAPVLVDGQQPTTWITDPTRFDVGNVDLHSLLLAPAERADVIVDFSAFAGQTLILYNDAPAAFPARVPSYDYYTGQPDLSPNGAAGVLPGYGPNTRTIMQVKIAGTPAAPFNFTRLRNAFSHKADGSGVFESSQHPIIVGQAAYNSAYGTKFSAASNCNAIGTTLQICDGFLRVNDTLDFGFNTLKAPTVKMSMPIQPKAIHDEMNSTTFDEFGRMQANLGIEAQPPTPGKQNGTFYPYVNPATELINGTNLPQNAVFYDTNGNPTSDIEITPISDANDGSQIWRITHNGVDTHPIHFHLFDVQMLNRVTWDNIVIPPEPGELGWKETIRVAPLEDTIVAMRPIIPELPWEVPNEIRNMNPMDPTGSTALFNNVDPQGNPTAPITNQLVNFGWEYVYHCHILSHEEMDMMRPVTLAMPPVKPDTLTNTLQNAGGDLRRVVLRWNDNSITETAFVVQSSNALGVVWTDVGTILSPLNVANVHQTRTFTDPSAFNPTTTVRLYRVVALNTLGYLDGTDPAAGGFPEMTAQSVSASLVVGPKFTVSASAGANGGITPSGAVLVGSGGNQTFTITPNAGFRRATVLVDGVNNPAAVTSGTYTFTNVTAIHSISATFTQSAATITATAGAGGSVTPPGAQTVAIGGNQTYTITPNNNFQIDTVLVDGTNDPAAVTSGTYAFTNVTANHTIAATFKAASYTITSSAGANGTITPLGAQTVTAGGSQSFTITPNAGYVRATVLVDGTNEPAAVTSGAYTFTNVTANHTISATFIPSTFTITASAGANGSITPFGAQVVATYSSQTFTITPNAGYHILDVLVDSVSTPAAVTTGTHTFTNVTANHTISATFEANPVVSVTAPVTNQTWIFGSQHQITWDVSPAVQGGSFQLWAQNASGSPWYRITPAAASIAASGAASYSYDWTVNAPAGSTYRIDVAYYNSAGALVRHNYATGQITVQSSSVVVTAPATNQTWANFSAHSVSWTGGGLATGSFAIWAQNSSGSPWYRISPAGAPIAATGQANYTYNFTVNLPLGSTYRLDVAYYNAAGTLVSHNFAPGVISMTGGVSVTVPLTNQTWSASSPQTIGWNASGLSSGYFVLWAVNTGGTPWYRISPGSSTIPATGAASYSYAWTVNVPTGSAYRIDVAYYNAAGTLVSHNYAPGQVLIVP